MTDIERCEAEIRQAEAAVLEYCDFGSYIWLQDWREELALVSGQSPITCHATAGNLAVSGRR